MAAVKNNSTRVCPKRKKLEKVHFFHFCFYWCFFLIFRGGGGAWVGNKNVKLIISAALQQSKITRIIKMCVELIYMFKLDQTDKAMLGF